MITSKRKVVRDEDRAEYSSRVSVSEAKEKAGVTFNEDLMMMRSYVDTSSMPAVPSGPVYKPAKTAEPVIRTEEPVRAPLRAADIMPTITRKRIEVEEVKETETIRKENTLTKPMKKALIAYMSVVLVLTIAVIATGIAISSVNADIGRYEREVSQLTQTMAQQNMALESLSDPEYIMGRAEALDMVKITSYNTTPQVTVNEPEQAAPTNPFDAFADGLSGMFGG